MAGIRKLAEHLDISIGTVSRALHGKHDVNEETRKRVLAAAEELGYVANQSGRSQRQGKTNVIGLMTDWNAEAIENSDNFFPALTASLQSVFSRHKLDLVMLPCPNEEDRFEYLKRMVARHIVDAFIITSTRRNDKRFDFLMKAKIPFVALGRSASAHPFRWADLDFEGVASFSVNRLVAKGHRRIAVVVPSSDINLGHVFLEGYRASLQRDGIAFNDELVIRVGASEQGGYQAGCELLQLAERPTAVILVYELMAIGLYRKLEEEGLLPGRDIAVIGFREQPRTKFLQPTLTCFRCSLSDLGTGLGEMLLSTMKAYNRFYPDAPETLIWPLTFAPGESDGPDR